jgi:hypothetical protein
MHDVAVRRPFVDEPVAGAVDQDSARQAALGQGEPRLVGERNRGPPPGFVHQIERRTGALACRDAVAGVLLGADRPARPDRFALVLRPHVCVVLESTGGDDYRARGCEQGVDAVAGHEHPRDAATVAELEIE